jgi:hypothetical protein
MSSEADALPVGIEACECLTPLGDAAATHAALLSGHRALELRPVLGRDGGDAVPLALCAPMDEAIPPRWLPDLRRLVARIPVDGWGTASRPMVITSSNYGVGSLHAFTRDHNAGHLRHGPPHACVEMLQREFGWGDNVLPLSHSCTPGAPTASWSSRSIS